MFLSINTDDSCESEENKDIELTRNELKVERSESQSKLSASKSIL